MITNTQTKPAQSWLWPDHNIGLRESRKLREEHNALVNSHAALVEALEGCLESMAKVRQDPFTTCACAEQLALAHRHATIALALAKEQS